MHLADIIDIWHHHDKFITADASYRIAGPHDTAQALCDRDDQFISGVMTVGIVDGFKAVEVNEQQRHSLIVARRQGQRLG